MKFSVEPHFPPSAEDMAFFVGFPPSTRAKSASRAPDPSWFPGKRNAGKSVLLWFSKLAIRKSYSSSRHFVPGRNRRSRTSPPSSGLLFFGWARRVRSLNQAYALSAMRGLDETQKKPGSSAGLFCARKRATQLGFRE